MYYTHRSINDCLIKMDRKRKNRNHSQENSELKRSRNIQNDNEASTATSSQITNGRAGRIIRVFLRNFMCHTSLEINLDLNTNYIIGRNGSGKSAILTALIVGLGGKARITNRGANMKSFIKVGQTSAVVEITLSNTGPMAFDPKVFGSEITIIRTFSDTGNSYKIKGANGSVVSSAFRDVNRLVDALNIHVDNPVCILNQDVARTFLNSNDPAKKYIMFMKATNLESVKLQYKLALQNKKKTSTVLHSKLDELKILEVEVKKWLKKYEAFKNVSKVEDMRKRLEIEAVWAQIIIIENELKTKEDKVTECEQEVANFSELITNKDDRKQTLTETVEQIRQQLLEIRNEEEINQTEITSKKNDLQKYRESIVMKKNEFTSVENTIKRKQNDKQTIEEEISRSSEYHKTKLKMIQERDQKMIAAEQKKNEVTKLLQTAENDLSQLRSGVKLKSNEQNNLSAELQDITVKVRQRQSKIRAMKVDEHNSVAIYGGTMNKVLDSINAHKEQFRVVPKGPIGSYIKLKDKKWALAVEDCISTGLLMAFCVDNQNDAQILSKIFKDCYGSGGSTPPIINSKFIFKVHNYSVYKTESPSGCISLIDALIVKDPVILNCLIDQLAIENILLVANNDLAIEILSNKRNVPRNCTKAFTLSGDLFFPDPNYRFYSCKTRIARYLQISASEAIKIDEEELRCYAQNEATVRKQLEAVSRDVTKFGGEIRALETKCSSYEIAKTRIEREIGDLRMLELPPEPDLQILTEEMEELTKIIREKQASLEKINVDSENIRVQMAELEDEYRELQNKTRNLETRMKPLIEQMADAELKLKQININARYHQDKLKQANDKLKLSQRELEIKQKFLQGKLDEASKLGDRVKTRRAIEVILRDLEDVKQQIEETRANLGDKAMISKTYLKYQQKHEQTKDEVTKIKDCLDQMVEAVESRARTYHRLAEYIGVRVKEMFTGVLKLRQFKGSIEIDHEKQTLELVVIPQHGSKQGTGLTHILSGGERSYSTVAFLHALWQVMEYPFYFLDEFDVFMDKVNRRTVMDILLEHAKEHKDLQFVFLTPQDVSNIVADTNITVHRMADPDRDKKQ